MQDHHLVFCGGMLHPIHLPNYPAQVTHGKKSCNKAQLDHHRPLNVDTDHQRWNTSI